LSANDLLLEVGCEEMPSELLPGVLDQLQEESKRLFKDSRINYSGIETYATPRRLVLLARGLDSRQQEVREEIKGPSRQHAFDEEGSPTRAAMGFARSAGVEVEDLYLKELKGTEYVMALRETPGRDTGELLPALMPQLLKSLRFARSMYWFSKEVKFIRPLRWLLCLWGDQVVSFEYAGVSSSRHTYGHRFLAPGPWEIKDIPDYLERLQQCHVILDQEQRKAAIEKMLEQSAEDINGAPWIDRELLQEVCFLVEYPEVVRGSFPENYLQLPREVLITTMQVHQRYFPVVSASGQDPALLPHFLGISNNCYTEYTRKGYEKVLQARLADADFFYREDLRKPFQDYVPRLQEMVFQEELGTIYDKSLRLMKLVQEMGGNWGLSPEIVERSSRAAYLGKADLMTNMVQEFPELQGVMGREYALESGEKSRVAEAIYEHYLPRFAGDDLPETPEGVLVSVADKVDTLAGCFHAGIQPSGSQDPYALRRQAMGVVSVLLEKRVPLSPDEIVQNALEHFTGEAKQQNENNDRTREVYNHLKDFIQQRIRYVFQEKGLSHHVIEAVLAVPYRDLLSLYQKAAALGSELKEGRLEDLLAGFTRVNNLARKVAAEGEVAPSLFQEEAEKQLWGKAGEVREKVENALYARDYHAALQELAGLRSTVDRFFDEVMVMVEEESLRQNRLQLLLEVKKIYQIYGDFSLVQPAV